MTAKSAKVVAVLRASLIAQGEARIGRAGATSYDMPEVLDRLIKALPPLEVDRRLQSLEQRTVRFR